uniref:uncharacterized protein LOC124064936 isoform X2 n=1 Tax=Scatophagus argus TaxID=75038 RepID=UPI001ED8390E|nr:uncharacterized protein LOC124064936 isoform X2 [Scatophagus argus]
MDAEEKKQVSSSSCVSLRSDNSIDEPPCFSEQEGNSPCTKTDSMNANNESRPTCLSLRSDRSKSPPPEFCFGDTDDRNVIPVTSQLPVGGPQATIKDCGLEFPPLIDNWTKEHVRDWLSGAAWNNPEIQRMLLRIKGKSENGEIYVHYGTQKVLVRPVYLGDIRSGYSCEEVSFYLGFTMEGPVAYNIKYENEQ